MRIGIVTQPLVNNYGGVMQNFALQYVLKRMGHTPLTLDYIPAKNIWRIILSLLFNFVLFFTSKRRNVVDCLPVKRDKHVGEFMSKYIQLTRKIDHYSSDLINNYSLNAIIVGSDQVWRPAYNDSVLYDNYLMFAYDYNIKKIAYAASFGVSDWEYTPAMTEACRKLVSKFDAISVRESSGVKLCNRFLDVESCVVLDPTLLLTAEDYRPLFSTIPQLPYPYALHYILDKKNAINTTSGPIGIENVVSVSVSRKLTCSIEEWLCLIFNAEIVITDSFHGMVFSVIFHKDFYVIGNKKRGVSRMLSILEGLGLTDRFILDNNFSLNKVRPIDWCKVDSCLNHLRSYSIDFLINSLK